MMRLGACSLLLMGILLISCFNEVEIGRYSPGSEIGDAVFRPLNKYDIPGSKKCVIGHVALYRNSDSKKDWDHDISISDSDFEHSVIQATGTGTELGWKTFQFFLRGLKQNEKGYTSSDPLSVETRKRLIKHAKEQYGAAYPKLFEEWYYPKIMTPNTPTEKGCFRCDALVEYVYEQEGLGFFDEDEKIHCFFWNESGWLGFPKFYPEALRKRMEPSNSCSPELSIVSPLNGAYIEPQMSIELTTNDSPSGSGIDRVEIYIDDSRIYLDDEDSDGGKTIHYTWNTQEISYGKHKMKFISYDRAGNKTENEILVYKREIP